ncbi:hypothetical protein CHLRE_03g197650v5 [Chlamydomonas reinhardtii]|uniref:Plastid lipid-associated protein/fibrillin conserved domain-containing protein n=1 Tax=Chlamydomonas reinhardtii TaxID=3055 RepID=A0A2K3DYR0_CHLRE|nr:uncharacterized protein CHLRE_03g197650v5 [Chlamydomonas reinhardtii]PNW85676.1 hypothetical protein CHLRE_03g197650v5 [Chlamydomonas reinhardtii]
MALGTSTSGRIALSRQVPAPCSRRNLAASLPRNAERLRHRVAAFESLNTDDLIPTKLELLKKVAGLNRGALASSNDKYEVSTYVDVLEEAVQSSGAPVDMNAVQGKWELIYSSVEQFRSSPFFWAFQEGLVQSRDIASQIFKFTDSLPGATIGAAFQTISFDTGKLISEVDIEVFPAIRGTVVTTSEVEVDPPRNLNVTVQTTRVSNSNVLPFVDNVSVPVQEIVEGIRGPGSTRVAVEITYVDSDMRIARTRPDGEVFVYRRV